MTRRESLLVTILLWTALVTGLGVAGFGILQRRGAAREQIALLEQQVVTAGERSADVEAMRGRRDTLAGQLAAEQARFYRPEEMDAYRFGGLVRNLLLEERLAIDRYQTIEVGEKTLLEFSVSGNPLDLLEFLSKVSEAPRYWDISFLSINARGEDGRVQSVLRIAYETIVAVDR